jgi:hypothetical protein
MSRQAKWEYLKKIYGRYRQASKAEKQQILNEYCRVCGCHRKHAIRRLNGPAPDDQPVNRHRARAATYGKSCLRIVQTVWEAAGYPWSVRLKALLPLWLPWIQKRFQLTPEVVAQLLAISPRQMDRVLATHKHKLSKRIYGRTKPGTLLKHHIPIRTDNWDVKRSGFVEVDLVSHSGNSADGEFIFSLNLTDIFSGWVETRAIMGKGQRGVVLALDELRTVLPFALCALDCDNGSEFINHHLAAYCKTHQIQFTRGRPYKKDDNAHIEQKNWTHVRKLMGWDRYDSQQALKAMNDFYRQEWRLMMNLFQPSVKLIKKVRVGSRLTRRYDAAQTPLDRLLGCNDTLCPSLLALQQTRAALDPFTLARCIEQKLERIWTQVNQHLSPKSVPAVR